MNIKHSILFSAIALSLTACGSSSDDAPQNTAPTSVSLSTTTVAENQMAATIGTLSATDAQNDTLTFELASGADSRFEINGNSLQLKADAMLDYEKETTITLPVIVSDGTLSTEETLTIEVQDELDFYVFPSKFSDGDSVSYSGQVARHVLIAELTNYIGSGLQADIENEKVKTKADALAKLYAYYYSDSDENTTADAVNAVLNADLTVVANSEQSSIADISSGKNLQGKIAGNDGGFDDAVVTQHKDWNAGTEFEAFSATYMGDFEQTPEALLLKFFEVIAINAEAVYAGEHLDDNNFSLPVYLTKDGHDLKQLVQKFLLGAVAYSQGTDDYLDDATDGKGLKTANAQDGTSAYSKLEHQWDEGFGYFGAARNYLAYTDEEIAGKGGRDGWSSGYYDINMDGKIDLNSEFNFGNSTNAAKRDLGSAGVTDYTQQAMEAFLAGRRLLNEIAGTSSDLTDLEMEELKGHRDQAVLAWEKSIAATVVHYINDTHADITTGASLADTAKHWSELKGFLIGLQFNPHSPLSDADFTEINNLIGDKPVLDAVNKTAYLADLLEARAKLQAAYSFDADVVANW
ncbi:DUF4856 domain-containing protein [Catenovulum sediminis]|uniref:DUF4856 domain-containing protein n=1 Tax=Catenovulum sediminis TaxID=1740262 RepID=UPI00117F8B97|nr:DUF4856 domain-containing protein [Catenovulum sediminis]